MAAELQSGRNVELFDVNRDAIVDNNDRDTWIHVSASTYYGDANLDGEFNSSDLIAVFQAGEYEDAMPDNSGWAEGDWDGDGDFASGDLVIAFEDGGYEPGTPAAVNIVPEPTSPLALLAGLIGLATVSNSRRKRV